MVSAKKLVQMAKKWQRMAALARKRVTLAPAKQDEESPCSTSSVAGKGHCVVYSADGRRFEVPLAYLGTVIFGELLSLSQEFGFAGEDDRITLPCEAAGEVWSEMQRVLANVARMTSRWKPLCKQSCLEELELCSSALEARARLPARIGWTLGSSLVASTTVGRQDCGLAGMGASTTASDGGLRMS